MDAVFHNGLNNVCNINYRMKKEPIPLFRPHEAERHLNIDEHTQWESVFKKYHSQFFHINRIEDYRPFIKLAATPFRHTVHDFFFLTNGQSKRSKGLDNYDFGRNTFFFVPANQITAHEYISEDATGYFCYFNPEIFNNRFSQKDALNEFSFLSFSGCPVVQIEDEHVVAAIINILERLLSEYGNKNISPNLFSSYLLALFFEIKRYARQDEKIKEDAATRIAQQYKNLLIRNIYEKNRIADYASMLNVSVNHLNKCIKTATSKSAQELLIEMMLMEAKALLKQTDLTVNEIAWKLRKEDPSDFAKFFKAKAGLTPTEYRRQH